MVGKLAPSFLVDTFDSLSAIKFINSPVLFIHGSLDKIVPKNHSKELYGITLGV